MITSSRQQTSSGHRAWKRRPIHIGSVDGDTFSKMKIAAVSKNRANSAVS